MRAGIGQRELTPPIGVELAGYGYYLERRARSVRDPLFARALLLEDGKDRYALLCCDLLGLSRAVCAPLFEYARGMGIPAERVLIVSIHTHTGPAIIYHEGCGEVDASYVSTVAPVLCQALMDAAEDLDTVVSLTCGRESFEEGYIYNRTIPDGPVDRQVRFFRLQRRQKDPIVLVSAACHGVFRGRVPTVSADFAGAVCSNLAAGGVRPLYLNGLCGDIDPLRQEDALLDRFAARVASIAEGPARPLPLSIGAAHFPFVLQLMPVTRQDIHEAAAQAVERSGGPGKPASRVAQVWEKEMLERFDSLSSSEPITVKCLFLGGVPILALPFEGFTQIGMDIRRLCGRPDALILGCAEQLLGYLPTRGDIDRGTYAALESTFLYKRLPVVPGEAERLGETLGRALGAALDAQGSQAEHHDACNGQQDTDALRQGQPLPEENA